jgi:hypothetical protein
MKGDTEGAAVWARIIEAIDMLRNDKPPVYGH